MNTTILKRILLIGISIFLLTGCQMELKKNVGEQNGFQIEKIEKKEKE
ncbi:hypothetical protein [Bacillus chungangensis]|uniref:PBP1b-binding outer membrane lipoprotein LpoB n=1 Tax=Bacillus chungangensis TaxID=587633 RepID=A0ABT9WNB0_9BACI|nr:hypothetical protein [Bacillus chungangensis]MDQ0174270.1 PBP1b-binding outer membrane lipoprotein LpoB [Bacillus chungangensis]